MSEKQSSVEPDGDRDQEEPLEQQVATAAALQETRDLLKLALTSAEMGWGIFDVAANDMAWDERSRAIMGFAPSEPVSIDRWLASIHPDDRRYVETEFQASLREGHPFNIEYRFLRPDGEVCHIHGTGLRRQHPNRATTFLVGTLRDVTEQRRAAKALREARENLELALWSVDLGWGVTDVQTGVLEQDARARAIAGLPPSGPLTLDDYLALIHPDDLPRVQADYVERLHTVKTEPLEYRIIRPDGEERLIRGTGILRRDENGVPWRMTGTLQDVTERRRDETALRRLTENLELAVARRTEELQQTHAQLSNAHERFRSLFQANPVPTVLYRPSDGVALDANPAFLEANDLRREDVVGKPAESLRRLLNIESSLERVEAALNGGRLHSFEREMHHPSGEMRTLLVSIEPIEIDGELCLLVTHVDITQRKKMEQELRHRSQELEAANHELAVAGERFRILFDTSPTPTAMIDPQAAVYLDANPAFLAFMGLDRDEVIGHGLTDVVREAPAYKGQETLSREFMKTGLVRDLEATFTLRSGERRTTLTSYARFAIQDRELMLATLTDITGRKETERRIREQQEQVEAANAELTAARDRFSAIFNANPTPSLIFDIDAGVYLDVNPAFLAFTGLAREDIVGLSPAHFAHLGDPERERELAAVIMAEGRIRDFETTFTMPGDTPRTVLASVEPVVLEGQACQVTTLTDITDRKEAERKIREQQALLEAANAELTAARDRFQTLFQANPVPSAMIDLDDMIYLNVNPSYLDFYGLEAEQVIGQPLANTTQWPDEKARQRVIDEYRRRGRLQNNELVLKLRSGEMRTVLASDTPLILDGRPATLATFIDITERKRAEQQARELATQLSLAEQSERQRISAILHDDLQQRLYALQVQLASAQALALRGGGDAAPGLFDRMQQSLGEALEVTRQLSVDLSPPILRGEGLYHALTWLGSDMKARYGLSVTVEQATGWRKLDEGLRIVLFQVVRELLFNVVKHANVTHVMVTLAQEGEEAKIVVSDAGVGFDASDILARSTSRGQGLQQARQRMELYGGQFEIESQPKAGTRVTITVPVLVAQQD